MTTVPGVAIAGSVAALLALMAVRSEPGVFDRFFAGVPAIAVVVGTTLIGIPVLGYLSDRGWNPGGGTEWAAWVWAAGAALALAAVAIGVDLGLRFPEDINVSWPTSLAAYPTIAFVVEIVLHALPLALLVMVFGPVDTTSEPRFWMMAGAVAMIEMGLQIGFAETVGTAVFSGAHLLAIGIFQVYLFGRFGFVPMLGFRLVYYSIWHVAWGAARLHLLF